MKQGLLILFALPLLALAACGGSAAVSGENSSRNDPNILTADQVRGYSDAFQAVQTLRQQWLRVRTPPDLDSATNVVVYESGVRVGGPEVLRSISTISVQSIQYFNGIAASQRWGLGHENGVIMVNTRN
jgi:hypothetical protein